MAKVRLPQFRPVATIDARQLAKWLDANQNEWWRVDGEPGLIGRIDFPCPGDELAEVMRGFGPRTLEILSDRRPTGELPSSAPKSSKITRTERIDTADETSSCGGRANVPYGC